MVMFNLFDILQAQGGGMQSLGQQFGLSPDQSRRAMEALLPALTIGLQRNAANDPASFGRLFGLAGADSRAGSQPEMLLGQLFGSPALSQAVLQQAAAASGIGQQALRQMLPIMAGMIVAGIVHMMLNQPPPAQPARQPEPQPPASFPAAELWNDWMNTVLSSTGAAASASDGPPSARINRQPADRPRSVPPERKTSPPPAPEATAPPAKAASAGTSEKPSDDAGDVPLEVFQQMFQTGVQVQEQNVKAMQDIFDTFWSEAPDAAGGTAEPVSATPPAGPKSRNAAKPSRKPRAAKPKPGNAT